MLDFELESPEEEANEQRKADEEAKPHHNPIIEVLDSSFRAIGSIFAGNGGAQLTGDIREEMDEESREADTPHIR